jgi:hypothetical protein
MIAMGEAHRKQVQLLQAPKGRNTFMQAGSMNAGHTFYRLVVLHSQTGQSVSKQC